MTNRHGKKPVVTEEAKLKGFDDYQVSLGDVMRGERATLGKSLLDVQRDLKIKASYIAAIENSDPSAFETQGFVAGYVRSYARYLGMDPEEAYRAFCRESDFVTAHGMAAGTAASKTADEKRKRARGKSDPLVNPSAPYLPTTASVLSQVEPRAVASIAVLAALVAGLGYGGWSVLQEIQRVRVAPVAQAPGVISTVDPLATVDQGADGAEIAFSEAMEPEVAEPIASLDSLYRPQALDVPVLAPRDGPIAAVDPSSVGALATLVPQAPEIDATPADPMVALSETVDEAVQVVAAAPPDLTVFAVRPAWVRVQAADGTVLFEKILDAGERYLVPLSDNPARLRAGNSGSVYFEIDGKTYGPAGDSSKVAKNIALGVDEVSGTYQIADIEADPALKRIVELAEAAREASQ
jgi:cytoskeletal protein RodZ